MKVRLFTLALTLFFATDLHAQIRASELATFSQVIDGTKISMTYSRPRARGRDPLFGNRKAVHWGEVWTPGANYATTFEVNRPVKLDGHAVKAGTYSVWMVVRQSGPWTMVLDPKVRIYHMNPPDSNATQIRFPVETHDAPYLDVLTWSMPELRANGGTLAMQWGRTRVDMQLDVEPSYALTMPQSDAAPYVGVWQYAEIDSGKAGPTQRLVVDYEDQTLKGRWHSDSSYFKHFALVKIAADWFAPGVYDDRGQVYEVYKPELVLEFTRENGRATSFIARDDEDKIVMRGKRIE
ncbi:MAG: DUF2911 domain-containing protein [Gemmatimonadetes bacterium]|nr:DUF2911 domain-containing protein [Gemmatimonadota bacterium]